MRALLLIAGVALALTACNRGGQSETNQAAAQSLTPQNIVSNDVTAIDAVTGDAANMAADVDTNYGNLDENGPAPEAKPTGKKPSPDTTPPKTSTAAEANITTNAIANGD